MLWATLFLINGAGFVGSMPSAGSPENITIMFLSPTSVKVSWHTSIDHVEKYDVTYKPTDASYRVVAVVAGNSDSVTLSSLMADTQYQITVTAVRDGKKYKSRPIVFRTLELPRTNEVQITPPGVRGGGPRGVPPLTNMPPTYIQVRGVEVGIVVLVLMVWVAAIILFFNRWGKIRMLLPYQPDYKDTQLKVTKVPGTGACAAAQACQSQPGGTFCCSQICSCPICSKRKFSCGGKPYPLQEEVANPQEKQEIFDTQRHLHHFGMDEPVPGWRSRLSRSRINSAVYIAHSSAERDPLVPQEHMVTLRRAVSAGNLRDRDHDSRDSDRHHCDFIRQESEPASHRLELPILSISEATEKPFVEQHL